MILEVTELGQLQEILNRKYASYLNGRSIVLSVELAEASVVQVEVLLKNHTETYYYPILGRVDTKKEDISSKEAALLLLDYIDFYLEEFFREDEHVTLNIDWCDYSFEGTDFQLKGQVLNRKLETDADALLSEEIPTH